MTAAASVRLNAVTISPSGGDDSVRINRAIRNGAATIYLTAGTFLVKHPIVLGRKTGIADGLIIQGAGRGRTIVHSTIRRPLPPTHLDYVKQSVFLWSGNFGPLVGLAFCDENPCYRRGTKDIRVADAAGFSPGHSVAIKTVADGPAELHTIAAKSGDTLTLTRPLEHDLDWDRWGVACAEPIRNLRISDLTISGSAVAAIELIAAERCSIERVEIRNFEGTVGINLDRAGNNNVIRDVSVAGRLLPQRWGVSLESQNQSLIENSVVTIGHVHGQFGNPISVNCATAVTVRDVVAYGSMNGVGLLSVGYVEPQATYGINASRVTIVGGDFSHNDVGIRLSNTDDAIITGSRIRLNNLGISIYGTSSHVLIDNVSLDRNAGWGIAFEAGAETAQGNKVLACQYIHAPSSLGAVSFSSAATVRDCP